jgi:pyruvate,water dikinase
MMTDLPKTRFPSPYDVQPPPGAEGWEKLYPYFLTFQPSMRERDEGKFWFCDGQHWPNVFRPFETITVEFACKCLGQYNTRHLLVPSANGVDYRILNGYCYMSPVAVDPSQIEARMPHFIERAGCYFQNWDRLLKNWNRKVRSTIADLEAIAFKPLPPVVPIEDIRGGIGLDPTFELLANYDRAIQGAYRQWQYHFEFLNLGYAAYLDFFNYCKQAFPDIPEQAIAKMVQGIEMDLFRPDEQLKALAKRAVELGITDEISQSSAQSVFETLRNSEAGRSWLDAWEAAQEPWFNFTSGNGFYASDKYWIEHPEIPLGYLRDYVAQLLRGDTIDRDVAAVCAERDRITEEYSESLDEEARAVFEGKLELARQVYPYVENHNFYIEHWSMSIFWRKMRELSRVLQQEGFWADAEDMFYISRDELRQVLFDYASAWAVGVKPVGPSYWPAEIARRRKIVQALSTVRPQPALNKPPAVITEPFTIMLWGITSERINAWLGGGGKSDILSGMPASPGTVEGLARVVNTADDLDLLQEGEILVATVIAPSWGPVFGKIRGTVTDIGGMMSHAAIVCREYGLPAVTGTGSATSRIKTGQRIRVNGTSGEVTFIQ